MDYEDVRVLLLSDAPKSLKRDKINQWIELCINDKDLSMSQRTDYNFYKRCMEIDELGFPPMSSVIAKLNSQFSDEDELKKVGYF